MGAMEQMSKVNGAMGMGNQALATLALVEQLLTDIRKEVESDPQIMCVTDDAPAQWLTKDFPYPGARRAIVERSTDAPMGNGLPAGLIYGSNANRIGGTIVNRSVNGLTLYLGAQNSAGIGFIWLSGLGSSWDFRLSGSVWCGNVYGVADTGNMALAGASV